MSTAAPAAAIQDPVPGVSNGKFAMWLFLVSDAMSFIGLLAAYAALRGSYPEEISTWDPAEWFGMLGINIAAVMTFILICSSVTMVQALHGFQVGDLKSARRFLLFTAFGGLLFLGGQVYEWTHMIADDKLANVDLRAATFYTLTGFHGMHVTGGVILLLYTLIRGKTGCKTYLDPNTIEIVGLYWHFVDLVWILIFTFVYLI